jgi:hypothetical protein
MGGWTGGGAGVAGVVLRGGLLGVPQASSWAGDAWVGLFKLAGRGGVRMTTGACSRLLGWAVWLVKQLYVYE